MDSVFDRDPGESLLHKFPHEQPEAKDFRLWKEAVGKLCSGKFLCQVVGKYLKEPHTHNLWSSSMNRKTLYKERVEAGEDMTDVYVLVDNMTQTRRGGSV